MKTNTVFARLSVASALLVCFRLAIPSVQAQTFAGKPALTESPVSLRTTISPVANSSLVRISYQNQGRHAVQIEIRDKKGTVLYDDRQLKRSYTGQFDMASLPAGLYIIELRTVDAQHTEIIRIEPLLAGRMIAGSEPSAVENQL